MAPPKRKRNSTLPERIEDPVPGTVRFSAALDGVDEYQAHLHLAGRRVTFDLYTDPQEQLRPCILRARRIVERFPAIQVRMRRYLQKEIYPQFNQTWRPNQRPLTLDQVLGKLKFQAVTTHPGPEAMVWLAAGDLFDGTFCSSTWVRGNRLSGTTCLSEPVTLRNERQPKEAGGRSLDLRERRSKKSPD